ncbi:NlpC/P60 family protein [Embleya sp. NBC_00888]|uniref:NlpC/P60 family protein n=1 Tax=Embleya sp. NBC_00888 TaxID=2975960 RepID=UPI003863A87B|nr:NlpC/P60 family protein [Embleya sp. NBC_00888]
MTHQMRRVPARDGAVDAPAGRSERAAGAATASVRGTGAGQIPAAERTVAVGRVRPARRPAGGSTTQSAVGRGESRSADRAKTDTPPAGTAIADVSPAPGRTRTIAGGRRRHSTAPAREAWRAAVRKRGGLLVVLLCALVIGVFALVSPRPSGSEPAASPDLVVDVPTSEDTDAPHTPSEPAATAPVTTTAPTTTAAPTTAAPTNPAAPQDGEPANGKSANGTPRTDASTPTAKPPAPDTPATAATAPGIAVGEPDPTGPAPATEPTPATEPVEPAAEREIVLRWGDTLWQLAVDHHTTVATLQASNGLGDSTLIYAGATLRVPGSMAPASTEPTSTEPTATTTPAATKSDTDTAGDADVSQSSAPDARGTTDTHKPSPAAHASGADAAVAYAKAQVGKPYRWGATGPDSFDCSGLVMRAWAAAGAKLPRTTWDMARSGTSTTRRALVPGDLAITNGGGHVQLYIGNGKVVHSPGSGRTVTVAPLAPASRVVAYRHITAADR